MPNDERPPQDYWSHMKGKGMSDELVGWIFYNKMGGDRAKASAAVKEGISDIDLQAYSNEYQRFLNTPKDLKETMVTTPKRNTLSECKDLKEALQLPGVKSWHPATRQLIQLAFQMADEKDMIRTLKEAEVIAKKDEDEAKKKLMETAAHGTEGSNQSSGQETPPLPASESSTGTIKERPGTSQLRETGVIDKMMEGLDAGSQDPLNTCKIQKMSEGMSEVDAHNACTREVQMTQGVIREALKPWAKVLKAKDLEIQGLKEALKIQDDKIKEIQEKGSIRMTRGPGTPGGNLPRPGLQETVGDGESTGPGIDNPELNQLEKIALEPGGIEAHRRDVMSRYTQ